MLISYSRISGSIIMSVTVMASPGEIMAARMVRPAMA